MVKRLTIKAIKKYFNGYSFIVLNDVYVPGKKIEYRCSNNHINKKMWSDFVKSPTCVICLKKNKKAEFLKKIKKIVLSKGWKITNTIYVNNYTSMSFICPFGHKTHKTWNEFQRGLGCVVCSNREKIDINKAIKLFESYGWQVLSKSCKNNRDKLDCICDNGHKVSICYNDFQQGNRCAKCYSLNRKGNTHYNYKGGIKGKNIPLYSTYASKLGKYMLVYKGSLTINKQKVNIISVLCHFCGSRFNPTLQSVQSRLESIQGTRKGSAHLYCSEKCKKSCSTYGQKQYPKGFKDYKNTRTHQTEWANLVKVNAGYTCEICGKINCKLIGHHEIPVIVNEVFSLDLDNGISICKSCHKKVHQLPWCTLSYLRHCGNNKGN